MLKLLVDFMLCSRFLIHCYINTDFHFLFYIQPIHNIMAHLLLLLPHSLKNWFTDFSVVCTPCVCYIVLVLCNYKCIQNVNTLLIFPNSLISSFLVLRLSAHLIVTNYTLVSLHLLQNFLGLNFSNFKLCLDLCAQWYIFFFWVLCVDPAWLFSWTLWLQLSHFMSIFGSF